MKYKFGLTRTWSSVVGAMIGSKVFMVPAVLAPVGATSLYGWVLPVFSRAEKG